ncbi:S1 RNA-binding domain-containing protein [Streptomyces sp. RFCAC02]|uniref:S1 RNA-binding domain-containing protein n=1 Tax=Streptomyces sp. RFCAC02 TaxID=2499143 RepID=UPI00101F2863|nr:S1 RNA-binding domain-containing protein [Streptomyces sp. RFCAC02]
MGGVSEDEASSRFLAGIEVGELLGGTVADVSRRGASVLLDGFPARPLGFVGPLDLTWRREPAAAVTAGRRITAEVIAVDPDRGRAVLSLAATENPGLWAFLKSLRAGEVLRGTVASVERFGVFVALDDGPDHPVFPGVGFITVPELSWQRVGAVPDVVRVGQRVSCAFLMFDTTNGEARLSLRATRPDPFRAFADGATVGQTLRGRVTELLPSGALVRVTGGVEGLIPLRGPAPAPGGIPEDAVGVGDTLEVVVTEIDRQRRRLILAPRG